ncbi:LysE family translocator [Vibrio sp. FNV 38]|nr:LysE family translocator [Vibrio sp. FNV 38]
MDHLLAIILFAVSCSITPGPNNIMVMTSGANFGAKKTLPLLAGICIGFTFMLLLVGFGFHQLFEQFPHLHLIIKCIGVSYLLYLAMLIARSEGAVNEMSQGKPFTFLKGALFQWVNAKAWIVATGAIAAFTRVDANFTTQNLMIAAVFLIVSFPCVGVWLTLGSLLKRMLSSPASRKKFNYSMSILLALSVVPVVGEIIVQLS